MLRLLSLVHLVPADIQTQVRRVLSARIRKLTATTRPRKKLRIGGVLRCCVHSLDEYEQGDFVDTEGTVMACKYCSSALIVRGGMWEWYRDYISESK